MQLASQVLLATHRCFRTDTALVGINIFNTSQFFEKKLFRVHALAACKAKCRLAPIVLVHPERSYGKDLLLLR